MLERYKENELQGSKIEQYARSKLSIDLNDLMINIGGEAIVGINTVTLVGELDIPIILILNNEFYKFGIEIDGSFHKCTSNRERDEAKTKKLNDLGYTIYRIQTKAYFNSNKETIIYANELDLKLKHVVNEMILEINNKIQTAS